MAYYNSHKWLCALVLILVVVLNLSATIFGDDKVDKDAWRGDDCRFSRRGCYGRGGGQGGFNGGRGGGVGGGGGFGGGAGGGGGGLGVRAGGRACLDWAHGPVSVVKSPEVGTGTGVGVGVGPGGGKGVGVGSRSGGGGSGSGNR